MDEEAPAYVEGFIKAVLLGTSAPRRGRDPVSSIEGRLRRLERRGRCPACDLTPDGPGRIAVINQEHPDKGFQGDPDERCVRCGRPLWTLIRVVYGAEEGEGAVADA